jgi:hypothetical protein
VGINQVITIGVVLCLRLPITLPGMRKPIRRDGDRKSKPVADPHREVAHTAESVLPPKKPQAPSVKHRLRRAKARKLKLIGLSPL